LFPVQAILYAKVVNTFQLTGPALVSRGNFWALMWFILAIVNAIAYFVIGGIGVGLGEVSLSNIFMSSVEIRRELTYTLHRAFHNIIVSVTSNPLPHSHWPTSTLK
jgi:hypothetical protein